MHCHNILISKNIINYKRYNVVMVNHLFKTYNLVIDNCLHIFTVSILVEILK